MPVVPIFNYVRQSDAILTESAFGTAELVGQCLYEHVSDTVSSTFLTLLSELLSLFSDDLLCTELQC